MESAESSKLAYSYILLRAKIRRKRKAMQQDSSLGSSSNVSQTVLQFHATHGRNVRLSADRSLARRDESFFNGGIVFSARPVRPNEMIYLRVAESVTRWRGTLSIGFTSINPESLHGSLPESQLDLPEQGFWYKKVIEEGQGLDVGVIIAFFYTASDAVPFNIDGTVNPDLMSGLTNSSLWVWIDIYGKTTAIEFIDPNEVLNNLPSQQEHVKDLVDNRLYHWRDWLIAKEGNFLHIRSDAAALKLNDLDEYFDFYVNGKNAAMFSAGNIVERSRNFVIIVLCRTYKTPIIPAGKTNISVRLTFGNWSLLVKERVLIITNSDRERQAIILRKDSQGFFFKSTSGTVQTFTTKKVIAPSSGFDYLSDWMRALNLTLRIRHPPSLPTPTLAVMQNFPKPPPLRHFQDHTFQPLTFHPCTYGTNIRMEPTCSIALRYKSYCNGYVMSARPIAPGESCVIQIVQVNSEYAGGLGFGMTACNPASLSSADLPDDANRLLDRREYWVFLKHVAGMEAFLGDEIEFHLSHSGAVTMKRNGDDATQLMHVDVSLPLWAVFDVFGSTEALRILGTIVRKPEQPVSQDAAHDTAQSNEECTICFERSVNCVLNSCGHMCSCSECATTLKNSSGQCPICRAPILGVIRIFRA